MFLVSSGCCNKITHAGLLVNNRNLFLIVLEAESSKIAALADLVSGEGSLPGYTDFLLCPCMVEGQANSLEPFFIKTLISVTRALPS